MILIRHQLLKKPFITQHMNTAITTRLKHINTRSIISTNPCSLLQQQRQNTVNNVLLRASSTNTSPTPQPAVVVPEPTKTQLRNHYIGNGLPMVGFGIMDQTVMIQAGNMIDCTLGVQFGLSTLTAAAFGAIISNLSGVIFGGTLENLAKAWGLPASKLTSDQRALGYVKRGRLFSQAIGILLGCCVGLLNILLIDTEKSESLKLLNKSEEDEFAFEVAISNDLREDATVVSVKGPDRDGILAGVTAALTLNGCSLLEVDAHSAQSSTNDGGEILTGGGSSDVVIEDTFVIVDQETKAKIKDGNLEKLCQIILDASREGPHLLKYKVKDLEDKNQALMARVQNLESALLKRRMSVKPSGKGMVRRE